jgi:hypothetical protein
MRSLARLICCLSIVALGASVATASSGASAHDTTGRLDVFTTTVDAPTLRGLAAAGYDIAGAQPDGDEVVVSLVLSPRQRADLTARDLDLRLWRDADGLTVAQASAVQQEAGFKVWRSFDAPGGIRDELIAFAAEHADLVKLSVIGTSVQDRDIIALKVTRDANSVPDGLRPAVLYTSVQHAREWITVEVNRRLLHHLVARDATDPDIRHLLDTTELWFVLVCNPDGYEQTHKVERMWRKNLRDNDGDGVVTDADGVDLNRNFGSHWGYDNAGSSPDPYSDLYRGASAASEPETQAIQGLMQRVGFEVFLNYHSVASLILYPIGWQDQTRSADDAIFTALAGTPDRPAVDGFVPTLSAGLYITNGETCDYAYQVGTLCVTVELSDQGTGGGFVFPDDEALVQKEFERNLPFALDVARSAARPEQPVSHLANVTEPYYVDAFAESYGDPQVVQVTARRGLGAVAVHYRVNDGPEQVAPTTEFAGGERYGEVGRFYARLRGTVRGAHPGDDVTVWFEAGTDQSAPFTYRLVSDTASPVLVLAAEDYTGRSPAYGKTDGPSYLTPYVAALRANGIVPDVFDIDAHGRTAPSPLGVLSHYRGVVWYTGDDIVPREAGMQPGTASRLANDTMLAVRDFLNEGGKLLYSGKYAGYPYLSYAYQYDAQANRACRVAASPVACDTLIPDFANYYLGLGGFTRSADTPVDPENMAGTGAGWWGGTGNDRDATVTRAFDLAGATAPVRLAFDAAWNIQVDTDYGFVEASTNGTDWQTLRDAGGIMTDTDPNNLNLGWGLTGFGSGRLAFDLSAFAGQTVQVRLRYLTDRRTTYAGWFVDNLSLTSAEGTIYGSDLEAGFEGWQSNGWSVVPIAPPPDAATFPVVGRGAPFEGLRWEIAAAGASNQDHAMAFTPISRELPADEFPQFASHNAAWYDDPATRAHSGEHYVYSGSPVYSFQRLTRTVDLTGATTGTLGFWISHDVRAPYDAIFVEARAAGGEAWTTLPEQSGHTSPSTALSCAADTWYARFPRLAHYMTPAGEDPNRTCVPAGTTGVWNAASGDSGGWAEWSFDLSAFAGRRVDVSIGFITSRQPSRGVLIDDITLSTGEATSFENDWGNWRSADAPEGSQVTNAANFTRATLEDMPSGAVVVTDDTITFGFGFEGIATPEMRRQVMERVLRRHFGIAETPRIYLPAAHRS